MPAIELAASRCLSDSKPIRGTVSSALESIAVDEGLQQRGFIAVTVRPIAGQTFGGGGQNTGRQVPHLADLGIDLWPSRSSSELPTPVELKALPMPEQEQYRAAR